MEALIRFLSPESKGGLSGRNDRFKLCAKNSLLLNFILRAFCIILSIDSYSFAQNIPALSFSAKLLTRGIGSRFDSASTQNRYDITSGLSIDDVVSTPLQSNSTINDTFIKTERQQGSLTFVYNTYNPNYVDTVVHNRSIEALDLGDSVSKQIAAYEGSLLLSRTLANSPIGNIFAEFSENLRDVRDALMVRIGHADDGDMEFEPERKYGKNPTFLELRLTPNTRDGLAPRLRLGENVSLSHDVSGSATFLEYNINF